MRKLMKRLFGTKSAAVKEPFTMREQIDELAANEREQTEAEEREPAAMTLDLEEYNESLRKEFETD